MQWRASARKAALIGVGYAGGRLLWDASTKKFGGDINTLPSMVGWILVEAIACMAGVFCLDLILRRHSSSGSPNGRLPGR